MMPTAFFTVSVDNIGRDEKPMKINNFSYVLRRRSNKKCKPYNAAINNL